jgi:hypothetical protein
MSSIIKVINIRGGNVRTQGHGFEPDSRKACVFRAKKIVWLASGASYDFFVIFC